MKTIQPTTHSAIRVTTGKYSLARKPAPIYVGIGPGDILTFRVGKNGICLTFPIHRALLACLRAQITNTP